jgi:UrcA family protein
MKESKLIKGVVAIVAVIAFSVPAIASAEKLEGRSEKVSYSDLNVDKDSGAQALYRRLQSASKRVCGVESIKNAGSVRAVSDQRRCYRNTMDEAVAKVNNPTLTKIHQG